MAATFVDTGGDAPESTTLTSQSCRNCSKEFKFKIKINENDETVSIIVGLPAPKETYVAISYVWGEVKQLSIKCQNCSAETEFPMASTTKFHKLLKLGKPGGKIWLDAISINQSDHADIAQQVAVMGDIYKNAAYVAVLLPIEDESSFEALATADLAGKVLLFHRSANFQGNSEISVDQISHTATADQATGSVDPDDTLRALMQGISCGQLCQRFFSSILRLENLLATSTYWSRAWTFQEWAMANDLWIEHESTENMPLTGVKSNIVQTMLMIANYKLKNGQYAEIDVGFSRGNVHPWLQKIKSLFPYEDLFLADHEVDEEKLKFQTMFPHFAMDQVLGLRQEPRVTDDEKFRARLDLMLNAFSLNKRTARYEADLVCCWASMCNISYGYSKDDSLAVAIQKVVAAIRQRGIKLYNFVVNTDGACAEVDLCFLDYAAFHTHSSAMNQPRLRGTPVFSGTMDTARHFRNVAKASSPVKLQGQGVAIQPVFGAEIKSRTLLSDKDRFIRQFNSALVISHSDLTGQWGNPLTPILEIVSELQKAGKDGDFALVTASVPMEAKNANTLSIELWAICPQQYLESDLLVAMESLNGTLVLATKQEQAHVVAYLVLTDQMSGSRLIEVDDRQQVQINLVHRMRSDQFSSAEFGARELSGKVKLVDKISIAFGLV